MIDACDPSQHALTSRALSAFRLTLLAGAALALAGCANMMPAGPSRAALLRANALSTDDPLEQTNRATLRTNKAINDAVISPAAKLYRGVLPTFVRDRISNGVSNLQEPRVFANDVLQLRLGAATTTLGRFLVNSTLGVGGTFDVADAGGLRKQSGDFGQTLFVWGVGSGPFLIAPVLGPTNPRDALGTVVDNVADPTSYVFDRFFGPWPNVGIAGVDALGNIQLLDDVEAGSVDFYGRLRSTYLQKRAADLSEAVGEPVTPGLEPPAPAPLPPVKTRRRK